MRAGANGRRATGHSSRRPRRAAKTTALSTDRAVIDRLAGWLAERCRSGVAAVAGARARQFQQLSAPLAAKAVEDTAFYRYGRLLSRNEVGFDVDAVQRQRRRNSTPRCGAGATLSACDAGDRDA